MTGRSSVNAVRGRYSLRPQPRLIEEDHLDHLLVLRHLHPLGTHRLHEVGDDQEVNRQGDGQGGNAFGSLNHR